MMNANNLSIKYKRILLKYSGEALMGKEQLGIAPNALIFIAQEVGKLMQIGVEVGLVIGGGNLFRGKKLVNSGLNQVTGDHMGMLATIMNALALRDVFQTNGLAVEVMSAIPLAGIVARFDRLKAITHIRNGIAVIFAAGTGNPMFTTDSAACLRAIEIEADIVLKATKVDGVYSADPFKCPQALRYQTLTYSSVLQEDLQVMDLTAICLCKEYRMPLRIFDMTIPDALTKIVLGEEIGTLIGE